MSEIETGERCATCDRPWSLEDFSYGKGECDYCKRGRSRLNRSITSRKADALDRLVDALVEHFAHNGVSLPGIRQFPGQRRPAPLAITAEEAS